MEPQSSPIYRQDEYGLWVPGPETTAEVMAAYCQDMSIKYPEDAQEWLARQAQFSKMPKDTPVKTWLNMNGMMDAEVDQEI